MKCRTCDQEAGAVSSREYHGVNVVAWLCPDNHLHATCEFGEGLSLAELEAALHDIAGMPGSMRKYMNESVIPSLEQAIKKRAADPAWGSANVDAARRRK